MWLRGKISLTATSSSKRDMERLTIADYLPAETNTAVVNQALLCELSICRQSR